MAVLGRTLFASSERVDLPDLLSIDSFTIGDFKYLIKSFIGDDRPYVLKGFEVIDPANAINSQNISIRVADSVVYYPTSSAGPFYYGLPEGSEHSTPLVPELRKNATNYVYLTFTTFDTAQDNRAFWDPDKNGGAGGEFNQNINTESVISVEVGVSVASFPADTIPICKVVVGPSVIESIQDCREMMFRLGTGGGSPDPFSQFAFREDPSSTYARSEPNTLMESSSGVDPFQGGDKNIYNLKEWMDAVMTKVQELGGTKYWYEDAGVSLTGMMADSIGTTFKSKGQWIHDSVTPGDIEWTEDIVHKHVADPREIIIRAASKSLDNEQVLYVERVRDEEINSGPVSVTWTNGSDVVSGTVASFENLAKGDWIKKKSDPAYRYLRVEEFYTDTAATPGNETTAALAQSILLSANYGGLTEVEYGCYTQGVYSSADVLVADRDDPALTTAAGNLLWLGLRTDLVMSVASIATTSVASSITEADGTTAKVTAASHGLSDGERVTITGSGLGYNGTYVVEVEDADTYYITTAVTGDESVTTRYAIVTTEATDNSYGLTLESANHGFSTDDYIIIDGTGLAYDSASPYRIKVRSATTFSIPVGSAIGAASAGTATYARVNTRTELGMAKVVQGEIINIGEGSTDNIRSFIGMDSETQAAPVYSVSPAYDSLDGQANYNASSSDSLTQRVSKLTAMMADKAQDRNIVIARSGYERIQNSPDGFTGRNISFSALLGGTPKLDIIMPSSYNNGTVTLSGTLTLEANEAAYITLDRNASFSATWSSVDVVSIEDVPLDENTFVLAYRLSGTDVWLWDGSRIVESSSLTLNVPPEEHQRITIQNLNTFLVGGGVWSRSGNTVTWSSDAYIRVLSEDDSNSTISAGNVTLGTSDTVAYVQFKRQTSVPALSVTTTTQSSLSNHPDMFVFAQKAPNGDIIIGGVMALADGESKELRAGLSEETKTLLGSGITEATDDPEYSSRGAPLRTITDSEGFAEAISNLDAEIDKWFGQLQLQAHPSDGKRVVVTGAERIMRDNTTISKTVENLLLDFDGAEIDFETGEIFADDGTTPLGEDFTPATIAAGQYRWYSVTLVYDSVTAVNRVSPKLAVRDGLADGASAALAPRAYFDAGIQLGSVVVQESGGSIVDIEQADIVQINDQGSSQYQEKIVDLYDAVWDTDGSGNPRPRGTGLASQTIDSVAVVNGYLCLSGDAGNIRAHRASGVGTAIVWTPVRMFKDNSLEASPGESIRIVRGTVYNLQLMLVDSAGNIYINNPIKQFTQGGAAHVEHMALTSELLADNTAVATSIFTYPTTGTGTGYRHYVIEYSLVRSTTQEVGQLLITTDGVSANFANTSVILGGSPGVTFSVDISAGNLRLLYTTTSTGSVATMKYIARRWL